MNFDSIFPKALHIRLLILVLVITCLTGCKLDKLFPSKDAEEFADFTEQSAEIVETAHDPNWLTSVDTAMQLAKRDNKLVMALFTGTDWCSFCIKLENEVFGTPEFRKWSDENVVPLMLDFPKTTKLDPALSAQNQKLKLKYKNYVSGYPTVLFLDPQGTVVAKMGYARGGPENWISKAEERLSQ